MSNWLSCIPRARRNLAVLAIAAALSACAAGTHHRKGMHALGRGSYDEAMLHLEQAAMLEPGNVDYRRDWLVEREAVTARLLTAGDRAVANGKLKEAKENFDTILKYDRENSRARAGLAALAEVERASEDAQRARDALKRGNAAEAARWADRALERSPADPGALAVQRDLQAAQAKEMPANLGLGGFYKKPVNLEFRDASVKMVFDALSRTTGINFIFDRDVKTDQRTTVLLKQTPLEDAMDVILATNQLEKKVLNTSSVLIYPNTPAKLKEHQDLLVRAFYLKNIDAKTGANILKTVLKIKDVYVDEKYHMLVLRENAETIELAEKLIALQDLEEPEVMLEVEVLEVNRNRLLNLGIQLTSQLTVSPLGVTTGGSSTSGGATANYKLSDLLNLSSDKLGVTVPSATVSFSKTDGDANLLANPRLRVRDRDKARILIGDKVPVVTTTTTPNGFLSENVQYLDVGLKLEVEPEIHLHDEIGLKLSLEVSSLVGAITTATGSQAYQIGTRNFSSSLRLKDGETQVLAGLISDADRSDGNRIPLLGDVPLLGRLFSSQKDDRQKTEIVMSITPRLIRNIQRRGPAAETFWSGTEATLRTKPIQLGAFNAQGRATVERGVPASSEQPPPAATADNSGVRLSWKAPKEAKVGQAFHLELAIDSDHLLRATPLQLAFDPAVLDVVAVRGGEFFDRGGKGQFNAVTDKASGRVSIGMASGDSAGVKGPGRLLTLELRPVAPAAETLVSVVSITPVGQTQAVSSPTALTPVAISVEP